MLSRISLAYVSIVLIFSLGIGTFVWRDLDADGDRDLGDLFIFADTDKDGSLSGMEVGHAAVLPTTILAGSVVLVNLVLMAIGIVILERRTQAADLKVRISSEEAAAAAIKLEEAKALAANERQRADAELARLAELKAKTLAAAEALAEDKVRQAADRVALEEQNEALENTLREVSLSVNEREERVRAIETAEKEAAQRLEAAQKSLTDYEVQHAARLDELKIAQEQLRACEASVNNECSRCHANPATARNEPCGHRMMCHGCAQAYRFSNGDKCNVCEQPSTVPPLDLAPEPALECIACCEQWAPRTMFVNGDCGHALCIGCTTTLARESLHDKTRITAAGLRCPGFKCSTRVGLDVIRLLAEVGSRTLPDARATTGDPPQPVAPLSESEISNIERFMEEEAIPPPNRVYCPHMKCMRMLDIEPPAPVEEGTDEAGVKASCVWCDEELCCRCHKSWNSHVGDEKLCSSVLTAEMEGDLSSKYIEATSKKCPECKFPTTHWHGHECHHIGYTSGGCPRCKCHWCYACMTTGAENSAARGERYRCTCPQGSWSGECSVNDVCDHLVMEPFPHDSRCGCQICPTCRPGKPCETCRGNCPVCRGLVPPGPLSFSTEDKESAQQALASVGNPEGGLDFTVGQTVLIRQLEVEQAKALMRNHGGWGDGMEQCIGKPCVVREICSARQVRCEHTTPSGKRYVWNPAMLEHADPAAAAAAEEARRARLAAEEALLGPENSGSDFSEGDDVRIREGVTAALAERMMQNHGGWATSMGSMLATPGKIVEVVGTNRVRIRIDGDVKIWNARLVRKLTAEEKTHLPQRPEVGDVVRAKAGVEVDGFLSITTLGTIVTDDGSDLPFKVRVLDGSDTHWYRTRHIEVVSSEDATRFAEARRERMVTFEPDLKSGKSFTTGQTIRIRDVSVSDADMVMTGRGGLVSDMQGRLGGIATVSEVISDEKLRLTYDGGGSHVWSPALVTAIPPDELASLPERIRVGSIVVMARGSTPEGVLTNGRLGRVITDDGSGMPYNVRSIDGASTHWYRSNQVELATEAQQETMRLAAEAKKGSSSGGFSFASNQRVRIKSMGIEEAKAKMVDHGGWADAMGSLLGTTATVLEVISETKVKLQHAGTTWIWNPAMLEDV